jgi:hypothetical protein
MSYCPMFTSIMIWTNYKQIYYIFTHFLVLQLVSLVVVFFLVKYCYFLTKKLGNFVFLVLVQLIFYHYYKMWIQFISPHSMDWWIHYLTNPHAMGLVNSLKIQWKHSMNKDTFCYNVFFVKYSQNFCKKMKKMLIDYFINEKQLMLRVWFFNLMFH